MMGGVVPRRRGRIVPRKLAHVPAKACPEFDPELDTGLAAKRMRRGILRQMPTARMELF
jgi:hypothetical protein